MNLNNFYKKRGTKEYIAIYLSIFNIHGQKKLLINLLMSRKYMGL